MLGIAALFAAPISAFESPIIMQFARGLPGKACGFFQMTRVGFPELECVTACQCLEPV